MFLGEFECKIDNKNRIFIPSSFRKDLKDVIITYIDEDTLIVRNIENWSPEVILSGVVLDRDKLNSYLMYIESNSLVVKVDSQGRIIIPLNIMKKLSFSSESIIIGKMDSFLIVNKDKYLEEANRINREWLEFLNSNQGKEFKASLVFRK